MKTLDEFVAWLEEHGRHATIIVSNADWKFLWERCSPALQGPGGELRILGRRILPALNPEPIDVSHIKLFEWQPMKSKQPPYDENTLPLPPPPLSNEGSVVTQRVNDL